MALERQTTEARKIGTTGDFPPPPVFKFAEDTATFNEWYAQFVNALQLEINTLDQRVTELEDA